MEINKIKHWKESLQYYLHGDLFIILMDLIGDRFEDHVGWGHGNFGTRRGWTIFKKYTVWADDDYS